MAGGVVKRVREGGGRKSVSCMKESTRSHISVGEAAVPRGLCALKETRTAHHDEAGGFGAPEGIECSRSVSLCTGTLR